MICVDVRQLYIDKKSNMFFCSDFAIFDMTWDNSLYFVS